MEPGRNLKHIFFKSQLPNVCSIFVSLIMYINDGRKYKQFNLPIILDNHYFDSRRTYLFTSYKQIVHKYHIKVNVLLFHNWSHIHNRVASRIYLVPLMVIGCKSVILIGTYIIIICLRLWQPTATELL